MNPKKIALFASGKGSNALNIIAYFKGNPLVEIAFVLSNKSDAPVISATKALGIKTVVCSNQEIEQGSFLIDLCEQEKLDLIVLAGFLRKIPADFTQYFDQKIVNIHPSLLPKYGGEGMYGNFVHQAVLANKEKQTGITIHFVNAEYDKGKMIAQFSCELDEKDTLESIQQKIHNLEMEHFPKTIEKILS